MLSFLFNHYSPYLSFRNQGFQLAHSQRMLRTLVTFALDGAEQPAHSSNHAVADSKLYSAKKGQHSVTLLVLVTLDGTILWLGRSQGGSTTNLALAHAELNTWLSQFDCDEHGIADASFNGTIFMFIVCLASGQWAAGGGQWAAGGRRQAAGSGRRAVGGRRLG